MVNEELAVTAVNRDPKEHWLEQGRHPLLSGITMWAQSARADVVAPGSPGTRLLPADCATHPQGALSPGFV